jgi:hypothetical protein
VTDQSLLWAARLNTDANGLVCTSRAVRGVNVDSVTPAQRTVIDSNADRAIAQARHPHVGSTPRRSLATLPGHTMICDGFGPQAAPSPVDGNVYQLIAVCENSKYAFTSNVRLHTMEVWLVFITRMQLEIRRAGHELRVVRLDRAPELRSQSFIDAVAKLGILVELTSREHHEGVGAAERYNDLLTRGAECMLRRAGLGPAFLNHARSHANWLENRVIHNDKLPTKYQRWTDHVWSFENTTPYIFGTQVVVVEDVRGPKGSLENPRASSGRFLGYDGRSCIVMRDKGRSTVAQHSVRPLNELALARSSLPSAVARADVGT